MMYYAITGSDMGYLRDVMVTFFGEVEKEEVFAEGQFDDILSKKHKCEANTPTGETGDPSEKKVYATSLHLPMELGVPSEDLPKCTRSWKRRARVTRS